MSEWKEYKLGEIMDLIGGGTPKTSNPEYWNGNIPWLSVADFNNGMKYCSTAEKKITNKGLEESSTKLLRSGQIIISARGTVGAISILKRDMAFNQSCYGIDAHKDITYNDFLYYLLKYNIASLLSASYGAVFDTITRETFDSISILLPSLPEQREIAGILSSLDDKIDLLNHENKTLEAMAETLFRKWFVEDAKEDWEEINLGSVVATTSGGTPSRENIAFYKNGTIDWVKSKELNGSFITETEERITQEAIESSSAKILPANSVLIAMYGATVGEYAIITKEMTCNQAVCALIPNEKYPYTYLYLWVKSMKEKFVNLSCGAAQQNISQIVIKKQPVCSDTTTIVAFHEQVEPYFNKIRNNNNQIHIISQLRDTLLTKLINGVVSVKK